MYTNKSLRNLSLQEKGFALPKAYKTGTTIAGLIFKDGIVLGADTRATTDSLIADKKSEKIRYVAPNIYCCGAGTAADTDQSNNLISSQLELHQLSSGRQSRVLTAVTMYQQMLFRHQGHISAALILGGVDINGPQLHAIHPHGSTDELLYASMGSGSLAAITVFESKWKENLEREDAIEIVKDAIEAGIFNDLGSGSDVNIVVIEKDNKVEILNRYSRPTVRPVKEQSYKFKHGTTAILKESIRDLLIVTDISTNTENVDAMDIS